MATTEQGYSRSSNRNDMGWKYCHPLDESNLNTIACNYWGKITKGGTTRAKEHLMVKKGSVAPCPEALKNAREELWKLFREKATTSINFVDNAGSFVDTNESEDEVEFSTTSNPKGRKNDGKKDQWICFVATLFWLYRREKRKNKDNLISKVHVTNLKASIHQYIAYFWYYAGLSFNLVRLKSFQDMTNVIGVYGPHLPTPTYLEIRLSLLNKGMDYTK